MTGHLWEFTLDDNSKFLVCTKAKSEDEAARVYRHFKGYTFQVLNIKYVSLIDVVE